MFDVILRVVVPGTHVFQNLYDNVVTFLGNPQSRVPGIIRSQTRSLLRSFANPNRPNIQKIGVLTVISLPTQKNGVSERVSMERIGKIGHV